MNKLTDNIEKARTASRERFENAKEIAADRKDEVVERMSDSKQRAAALLGEGKTKAAEQVAATREVAKKAANKSEEAITKSPLAVVAGGVALGALIGALLPKSKTEDKYVGGAGRKINETAKKAFEAAKEAGQDQIDELGLSKDSVQDQIKDLLGKAGDAAKSAALAAKDSVTPELDDK